MWDPTQPTCLEVDALGYTMGGVLLQCLPPPLDMSVTVKGHKSGNFNHNFYYFSMASKTLALGLYKV